MDGMEQKMSFLFHPDHPFYPVYFDVFGKIVRFCLVRFGKNRI